MNKTESSLDMTFESFSEIYFEDMKKRLKDNTYERQKGICPICNKHYEFAQMHGNHIKPWHAGGKTVPENLQMLCRDCNLKKSGQE